MEHEEVKSSSPKTKKTKIDIGDFRTLVEELDLSTAVQKEFNPPPPPPLGVTAKLFIRYMAIPIIFVVLTFMPDDKKTSLNLKVVLAFKIFFYTLLLLIFSKLFGYVLKNMMIAGSVSVLVVPLLTTGIVAMNIMFIIIVQKFTESILA